ncbi:hypothetical protein V8E54_005108 [Elaphomyces granulatus]
MAAQNAQELDQRQRELDLRTQEVELEMLEEDLRQKRIENDARDIENDLRRLALDGRRFFLERAQGGDLPAIKLLEVYCNGTSKFMLPESSSNAWISYSKTNVVVVTGQGLTR